MAQAKTPKQLAISIRSLKKQIANLEKRRKSAVAAAKKKPVKKKVAKRKPAKRKPAKRKPARKKKVVKRKKKR